MTGAGAERKKAEKLSFYPAQYYYLELNTARMLNELNIVCPEDKRACQAQKFELIEKRDRNCSG